MVADCWVFVAMGRFYLQSNTARIVPSTLTINGMSHYSGPTNYTLNPSYSIKQNEGRLSAFFPGLTTCSNFFTIYAYAQAGQLQNKTQPESSSNPFVVDSEVLTKTLVEVEITTPATASAPAEYKVKKLYSQNLPMGD
jgi:hypothetical protein